MLIRVRNSWNQVNSLRRLFSRVLSFGTLLFCQTSCLCLLQKRPNILISDSCCTNSIPLLSIVLTPWCSITGKLLHSLSIWSNKDFRTTSIGFPPFFGLLCCTSFAPINTNLYSLTQSSANLLYLLMKRLIQGKEVSIEYMNYYSFLIFCLDQMGEW